MGYFWTNFYFSVLRSLVIVATICCKTLVRSYTFRGDYPSQAIRGRSWKPLGRSWHVGSNPTSSFELKSSNYSLSVVCYPLNWMGLYFCRVFIVKGRYLIAAYVGDLIIISSEVSNNVVTVWIYFFEFYVHIICMVAQLRVGVRTVKGSCIITYLNRG